MLWACFFDCLMILILWKYLPKLFWTLKPWFLSSAFPGLERAPSPDHLTSLGLHTLLSTEAHVLPELRRMPVLNTQSNKCVHLARYVTRADGWGDAATWHMCALLWWMNITEEGHRIWSGGVSCQITIISFIWWNKTHHKEVYDDEVGWKWAVWGHRGRWETDPVLCASTWAESFMPSFSNALSSLAVNAESSWVSCWKDEYLTFSWIWTDFMLYFS